MRFVLLLLLTLFAASTAAAQATGSCAPELVGSPSCPYQWVGATSVAFTGNGNGLGFVGMTTQCRADFGPGARMCKSEEIMDSDTLDINSIPALGCWVRPSWRGPTSGGGVLDESGRTHSAEYLTCQSWNNGSNGLGLALMPNGVFTVQTPDGGLPYQCSVARPVACCKPQPLPAPSASLSLPIGAGALAGLAMLKGGA